MCSKPVESFGEYVILVHLLLKDNTELRHSDGKIVTPTPKISSTETFSSLSRVLEVARGC